MPAVICTSCGKGYPNQQVLHACQFCGGLFDYDEPPDFQLASIENSLPGIWRYRNSFGLPQNTPVVSLGEGSTPLVWLEKFNHKIGLKMESQNPTGSYKDRGTAPMISTLLAMGVNEAVEDSSGNAGASFAAYAARAGIKAQVYVPASACGPKRNQIEMFGADLFSVPGPRANAAAEVLKRVREGAVYASHAYLPFGLPAIATIAYEIWEQMGGLPGTVIVPCGHGGLLLGLLRGFAALNKSGLTNRQPYFIGVQAQNCCPIYSAFKNGKIFEGDTAFQQTVSAIQQTVAEGVSVAAPTRLRALLGEMPPERGRIMAIEEGRILPAMRELAGMGFYVEPTSALGWCALQECPGKIQEPIVLIISGSGLKYFP
jgi:threonine synthase